MLITGTYKYKLYHSKKNKTLHQQIDIAGLIYNHCIALHGRYYGLYGKRLNQYQMKHMANLKRRPKYAHWNKVGSQAIQDIIQRIEKAYQLFYPNLKHGIKTAPLEGASSIGLRRRKTCLYRGCFCLNPESHGFSRGSMSTELAFLR